MWRGGIYQVKAEGGIPALLLEADPDRRIDFHYPSWLPNGDLLYLVHWKDQASQGASPVLAVHDGTKEIPLAIDIGDADAWPMMTTEGFILYLRLGVSAGLWAVPYDVRARQASGESFRVSPAGFQAGTPKTLFNGVLNLRSNSGMSYDVDPSGNRFLMLRQKEEDSSAAQVRIVLNWSAPMDGPSWGTFTTGGAWLSTHLWEPYLYTGDKEFLREYWPVLKGSAEFFLDFLVPHPRYGATYTVTAGK